MYNFSQGRSSTSKRTHGPTVPATFFSCNSFLSRLCTATVLLVYFLLSTDGMKNAATTPSRPNAKATRYDKCAPSKYACLFPKLAAARIAGVIPGIAWYPAAVFALAAVINLVTISEERLKGARLARTRAGKASPYLLFVTFPKMAVATAPASRREVPARPAAVPISS